MKTKLKIKSKRDNEIALVFFRIGAMAALIYTVLLVLSAVWIYDVFKERTVERAVAAVLWGVFWIFATRVTSKHVVHLLEKAYGIEFVRGNKKRS